MNIKRNQRRINALARLEKQYAAFKENKADKQSWETTRRGFPKVHQSRTFADECKRMADEISTLKSRIK